MPIFDMLPNVGLEHYLVLSAMLFFIGVLGVLRRRDFLGLLVSFQICFSAIILVFISFSKFTQNYKGQVMALFVLGLVSAQILIGMIGAWVVLNGHSIKNLDKFNLLRR